MKSKLIATHRVKQSFQIESTEGHKGIKKILGVWEKNGRKCEKCSISQQKKNSLKSYFKILSAKE